MAGKDGKDGRNGELTRGFPFIYGPNLSYFDSIVQTLPTINIRALYIYRTRT